MDAGLAAVLGAGVGALATTGAALATGWASREQSKIGARAEHRRQRREPRKGLYKQFIDAASTAEWYMAMPPLLIAMANQEDPLEEPTATEHAQRCRALADDVKKAWLDVVLAGPAEVAQTASEIEECCRKLAICADAFAEGQASSSLEHDCRELMKRFSDQLPLFITQAREALDDDGTAKRR
jgi:hypothetical protein